MCGRKSFRQSDKNEELMSDWVTVSVWGGETEGERGGNEQKEKGQFVDYVLWRIYEQGIVQLPFAA